MLLKMSIGKFSISIYTLQKQLFTGKVSTVIPPLFFYLFYSGGRSGGGDENRTDALRKKMHTQSLIIIDFPCNPVLADVKGPWGPIRDVLTQPATLGSGGPT